MQFNPLANFMQGQQAGQAMQAKRTEKEEEQLRRAALKMGERSEEYKELMVRNPESAMQLKKIMKTDDGGLNAMIDDTMSGIFHLKTDPTGGTIAPFLQDRVGMLQKMGRDTSHTQKWLDILNTQGPEALLQNMSGIIDTMSHIKAGNSGKDGKTANQKDWDTFQELTAKSLKTGNPKDKVKAERFGRGVGFIRESEQEKADITVSRKEREAIKKATVLRKQGFIDSGIEAANGAANVRRALGLLDEVETGGFDNLALKAKKMFGVEGADEGELSNLMGKAVLAQLKPIFGAAFTVTESNKLDALEAGFGKSPANNKRLLENALKIIDRAARRGIAAAEDQEDFFTADEIRGALAFELKDKIPDSDQSTGMTEQDKQALEWAKSNPNDPRSAAILQKMGVK
jgi:hypothetical protein